MSLPLEEIQPLGFDYQVRRSHRKTAAIHVGRQGVEVRIPGYVSDQWAHEFILSKQQWISHKLSEQSQQQTRLPMVAFGQCIWVLGESIELRYQPGVRPGWLMGKGVLSYQAPTEPTVAQLITLLQGYFKQLAQQYMPVVTQQMTLRLNQGHKLQKVVFRRTKSKWGHCTSSGVIQYNWLIMGAPKAVIDYLICHEVSHLVHHNHSPAFWLQVANLCPDYKHQQAWLKQHSVVLSWC